MNQASLDRMNLFLVIFAAAFLGGTGTAAAFGQIPGWIGAAYWGGSLLTACLYAWDKYRARRLLGRTAEKTLHLFELFGGWPGALLSQRILRHKNRKASYQRIFWLIVMLHLAAWFWILSL